MIYKAINKWGLGNKAIFSAASTPCTKLLKEVLEYPLTPVCTSLGHGDGTYAKTDKAK